MPEPIAIVDLFSGPGGLGEGFSECRDETGKRRFKIAISIEKEASAHRTLRLRAFTRQFETMPPEYLGWLNTSQPEPDWGQLYPDQWKQAEEEARCLELGKPETETFLAGRITNVRKQHGDRTVLIGGPPCQAYSLVGRARNAGIQGYSPELDHRNFLYDEYINVLRALQPAVFVMENVKGMLSAAISGNAIFLKVMQDLREAGYRLVALSPNAPLQSDLLSETQPKDFIVRAEDHGVPQARHRVIIVGLREDLAAKLPVSRLPRLLLADRQVSVGQVIGSMSRIRSGLSRSDSVEAWISAMGIALDTVESAIASLAHDKRSAILAELHNVRIECAALATNGRTGAGGTAFPSDCPLELQNWLMDPELVQLSQNDTRGHMPSDLARYLFVSSYGKACGVSPKASDFPASLAPNHRSWESGKFADRFRVQLEARPATTITSHISKDGHYFIHPDPSQCRSLTVREAARLQTFPDNYAFLGNRTQQFVQVGNAVPPYLALQIARAIGPLFHDVGA